ncbi:putative TrmH family tRNA/rRNA methyltransferase [Tanacetum coccineum]
MRFNHSSIQAILHSSRKKLSIEMDLPVRVSKCEYLRRHSAADLLNLANSANIKVALYASVDRVLFAPSFVSPALPDDQTNNVLMGELCTWIIGTLWHYQRMCCGESGGSQFEGHRCSFSSCCGWFHFYRVTENQSMEDVSAIDFLCFMVMSHRSLPRDWLIIHNIAKRHNVGTLAGSATAFGVSELILVGRRDFNSFSSHGSTSHLPFRHFNSLSYARLFLKVVIYIHITESETDIDCDTFIPAIDVSQFQPWYSSLYLYMERRNFGDSQLYFGKHGYLHISGYRIESRHVQSLMAHLRGACTKFHT